MDKGFSLSLLIIILFLSHRSNCQYFPAKVYTVEDGIPSHSIFDVTQTPDNLMWFLSSKGVFNYDAVNWTPMPDSLELPTTAFSLMVTHSDGSLWLAGQNNINFTVKYLLENVWYTVELPPAIKKVKAGFAFNVYSKDDVYHVLIGVGGVLYDINVETHEVSEANHHDKASHINTIRVNANEILVATKVGVFEYRNGELIPSEINNLLDEGSTVLSVLRDRGTLYLLGIGWLAKWRDDNFEYLSKNIQITRTNIYNKHNLEADSQGRLYFSSETTPALYDPIHQSITELKIKQVDFIFYSSRIFIDKEENVWAGDYRGLFKYNMSSFQNYNHNTGLAQNEVSAITTFNNNLVIANTAALNFMQNGEIIHSIKLPRKKGARILDMQKMGDRIYLAGDYGGLYLYENETIKSLQHLLPTEIAVTSLEIYNGELHVSGSSGVFKLTNGRFEKVISITGLRNLITVGTDSLVIFTYRSGVLLYHNGDTTRYTATNNKYNSAYTATKWNNEILLGTSNGMAKLSAGKIVPLQLAESLKYAGIYAFVKEDEDLWIGSSEGIHKWDGKDLITYNQQKGLLGLEVNRNAFVMDASANLWIGTESGVSLFPYYNRGAFKVNKNIFKLTGTSKHQLITHNNQPKLKHDDNDVTFEFVWPTFKSEQATTYRYRLTGLEEAWTDLSGENVLTYSKLNSGQYKFEIQANLSGLIWSDVESLSFEIGKPFYATRWFIFTSIFTVLLLLYLFYRIRFYYFLKRQASLEKMIASRTTALAQKNQEIIQINTKLEETISDLKNTQRILVHSEKMASLGTMSAGIGHEINNPLNFIKGGVTILFKELPEQGLEKTAIEDALQLIDAGVHRVNSIVSSLSQFSSTSTRNDHCKIHEVIDNCLTVLHGSLTDRIQVEKQFSEEVLSIEANVGNFHQAIFNVLSNACQAIEKKGKIEITTRSKGSQIEIVICDDGRGLDPENAAKVFDPFFTTKDPGKGTGLGLSIAYNIIKEHDGTITFESSINEGACVTISLPKVDTQ